MHYDIQMELITIWNRFLIAADNKFVNEMIVMINNWRRTNIKLFDFSRLYNKEIYRTLNSATEKLKWTAEPEKGFGIWCNADRLWQLEWSQSPNLPTACRNTAVQLSKSEEKFKYEIYVIFLPSQPYNRNQISNRIQKIEEISRVMSIVFTRFQ